MAAVAASAAAVAVAVAAALAGTAMTGIAALAAVAAPGAGQATTGGTLAVTLGAGLRVLQARRSSSRGRAVIGLYGCV